MSTNRVFVAIVFTILINYLFAQPCPNDCSGRGRCIQPGRFCEAPLIQHGLTLLLAWTRHICLLSVRIEVFVFEQLEFVNVALDMRAKPVSGRAVRPTVTITVNANPCSTMQLLLTVELWKEE